MVGAAEWLLLELAAEQIGEAALLPAWREGALRSVPIKTIAQKALQIGEAKLNRALLEGTLPLRGVERRTDEEIDIPSSVAGRFALDCVLKPPGALGSSQSAGDVSPNIVA